MDEIEGRIQEKFGVYSESAQRTCRKNTGPDEIDSLTCW